MKRKSILIAIVALVALFLGLRSAISSHGEAYFKEYLRSEQRASKGRVDFTLQSYENGFGSAVAKVKIEHDSSQGSLLKSPLHLDARIEYGPLLLPSPRPVLLKISLEKPLPELLSEPAAQKLKQSLKKPVTLSYEGVMDWTHSMHEELLLSAIDAADDKGSRLKVAPVRLKSDYRLETLEGRWSLQTERLEYRNKKRQEHLVLEEPSFEGKIEAIEKSGLLFGEYRLDLGNTTLQAGKSGIEKPIRFTAQIDAALKRTGKKRASFSLGLDLDSHNDPASVELWEGIRKVAFELKLQGLGIEGLRGLLELQKEREALQRSLAKAVGAKDDTGMQKAILAIQALEGRWSEIYNTLLIPGQTTLKFDEEILGSKKSRLSLDLRFTGKPLRGNALSAMISLVANADKLVEGSFELELEKALAKKFYPNALLMLDSMVSKAMASFQDGIYRLQGRIEDGKIVINGTKYAPQELMMLILS